jgi:hypothetical protein
MAAPQARSGTDRAAGGWRSRLGLTVPDLAWEFLRRNADYRVEFARVRGRSSQIDGRWGLRFGVDPDVSAPEADVFWRADVAPGLVVPFDEDRQAVAGEARSWRPSGESRRAEDGLHVRLPEGLQLQYRGSAKPDGPLLVVLSFDQDFGLRVRAVERLNRTVEGLAPPPSHITGAQRERLAKSLLALDGALAGESYRAIAGLVFGQGVVEREAWRTSSVRAATIRLVQAGRDLMRGGYLKILRGGL